MLHSYLAVEGMDNYWLLYSLTEVEGTEHQAEVVVATGVDGRPLLDDGLKLVSSGDKSRSAGSGISPKSRS
jgi:hypothetical protein